MSDHRHQRLEDALARRDKADAQVKQLQGRLAAAEERVETVRAECEERGVKPEQLDAAIAQLEKRYDKAVATFEQEIETAEAKLAPFKEDRP